jgi:hypothetical protein
MSASDMRGRNKEVPDVAALIRATVLSASASGSAKSLLPYSIVKQPSMRGPVRSSSLPPCGGGLGRGVTVTVVLLAPPLQLSPTASRACPTCAR